MSMFMWRTRKDKNQIVMLDIVKHLIADIHLGDLLTLSSLRSTSLSSLRGKRAFHFCFHPLCEAERVAHVVSRGE